MVRVLSSGEAPPPPPPPKEERNQPPTQAAPTFSMLNVGVAWVGG